MKVLRNMSIVGLILLTGLYLKNGRERMNKSLQTMGTAAVEIVKPEEPKIIEVPRAIPVVVRELLPIGEFVTTERIKEVTPDGVRAIQKGVRVKLIEEKEGKLIVSDSKVTVPALASQLTNDKEKAASFLADALAYKPVAPVIIPDVPVSKPQEVIRKPDYSAQIAQYDARIESLKEKIKDLKNNKRGTISANGALIARLELELAPLEVQRNRLLNAQR